MLNVTGTRRTCVPTRPAEVAPTVAQAGISAESITVSPASVETGASFTVTGFGWNCGVDVDLTITLGAGAPVALGTIASADITLGGFTATFTAPAAAGAYVVTASEGECQGSATDDLTVTDPPTTTTSTTTTTTSTTTTTLAPTTTTTTTVVPAAAPPAATLPQTGDGSETLGIGAALVIALGTIFLLVARRPKHI